MPDFSFFQRFDNLGQESASLANSANALVYTNNQLGDQRRAENNAERARLHNAAEQARRRRKIENCQNHWFYSSAALQPHLCCSGGVEGRIQRQTEKLAADEAAAPALMSKEAALEGNVAQLEDQQAQLEGQVARRRALDAERRSMFDSAVAGAPTAQLHSLNASVAQWGAFLAAEQACAAQLQHAAQGCASARQGYYGAIRALHSAASTNNAAGFNNIIDGSGEPISPSPLPRAHAATRLTGLAVTRYSFTSRRLCTNQSSFHSPRPPALATLLQYKCTTVGQYTSPPPTSLLYAAYHAILVITISCKDQHTAHGRSHVTSEPASPTTAAPLSSLYSPPSQCRFTTLGLLPLKWRCDRLLLARVWLCEFFFFLISLLLPPDRNDRAHAAGPARQFDEAGADAGGAGDVHPHAGTLVRPAGRDGAVPAPLWRPGA